MNPAQLKDEISFEDFEKLDIRIRTIISVSEIKKSNVKQVNGVNS